MSRPLPIKPRPGQESVWDYPRPPRVEAVDRQCEVIFGGHTIAVTLAPLRVLETSHPPSYYFPPDSVLAGALEPSAYRTYCEYKGVASYFHVVRAGQWAEHGAWTYAEPSSGYEAIAGYISFYPQRMEVCLVEGEMVRPQPGRFYGGWVTSEVVGPFKGVPGSASW